MLRFFIFWAVVLFSFDVFAAVKVVDGDSLEIDGKRVRLEGIDAPEYDQFCENKKGVKYNCGLRSKEKLLSFIDGRELKCDYLGTDVYDRLLAICYAEGENINKKMVETGWAVSYNRFSEGFDEEEKKARKNKRGMWQGKFMRPELFRFLKKN